MKEIPLGFLLLCLQDSEQKGLKTPVCYLSSRGVILPKKRDLSRFAYYGWKSLNSPYFKKVEQEGL